MSKIKSILAFVALLLCGGAFAATPVAVWNGDLTASIKGGYKLSLESGATAGQNGVVNAAKNTGTATEGLKITCGADISPSAKDFSTPKTIAVKYSGLDKTGQNDVFLALERADGSELLIYFKGNNLGLASPNSNGNILGQTACTPPDAGIMMISTSGAGTKITCQPTSGTASTYELTTSDDAKVSSISAIRIGGAKVRINWYYRPGMTIEAVAVFNGIVDSADIGSIDWTATATSNASSVSYTNTNKGLSGSNKAGAQLTKLRLAALDGLSDNSVVRVKSIAIAKRSDAGSYPTCHHLTLEGVDSLEKTDLSLAGFTMSKYVFDKPLFVKVGTDATLISKDASGNNTPCNFALYQASSEIDNKYKAVWCDWLSGKQYTIPYVIELEEYTYLKYANSTASLVYGDGTTASPKAGDTIVIDDSHYTDIWKVGNHSEFTTFPILDQCKLVLYSRMNLYHSIAANQKVEVNADAYLYGNVGAGVVISGKGNFDVGYSGNSSTIGNGVIIGSKTFTIGSGKTAKINGSVMITSSTITVADASLVLNTADASITAPSALTSAKISSSVEGKEVKSFDNQDGTVTYSLKDAPVATVYGVVYTSLKSAIEAADAGATITLLRDWTLEINEPISKAVTISAAAAKTLTLVPGEGKAYVSAADIVNLTLGANVSLSYGDVSGKVISLNFNPGAGDNAGAMPDDSELVSTMAGNVSNESWNNMTEGVSDTEARTVSKMYLADGTTETVSGLTAVYSGRAYYNNANTLNATVPYLKGYIDDGTGKAVTIKFSGIPFKRYDIILYFQGDTASHVFRAAYTKATDDGGATWYDRFGETITDGTQESYMWGHSLQMSSSYANNVMRIPGLSGSDIIVGSLKNGGSGNRGSIAAVQIVQMSTDDEDNAVAQIGEKFYGTLARAVAEATSGQTIKLLKDVALESATTLPTGTNLEILEDVELDTAGFTFTGELNGSGKIIYHGGTDYAFPANPTLGNNWTGICSFTDFCNATDYTVDSCNVQFHPDNFANENSKIEFNGVKCYMDQSAGYKTAELIVTDKGSIPGWVIYNGWSHYVTKFKKLSGTGTIFSKWAGDQRYVFASASKFDGNITISRNDSARGPKIIFGSENIPAQSDNGPQIFVLSDAEVTMSATKNWTAKSGIKVDGTLNFAAETSGTARFFSSPLSGSGTINLASPSSGQTKIVFTNAAQAFVGSIAAKQHAHFVFAAANKSSTGMSFSNSGYVCVETGSATLAAGKTWSGAGSSGYGVFVENQDSSPATLNLEGDATITGKLFVRSGANLKFLNYGTTTVSGNIEPASATINVTLPSDRPTGDFPKTLLTWNGTLSSGVNFACANIPDGFLLVVKNDGLYLEAQADITTSEAKVANNVATAGYISVGQNGVYSVTGNGGLTIDTLKLKNGSKIVFDPVRNPILANALTIESGATIKLVSGRTGHTDEYEKITCGLFRLFSYPNTIELNTSGITIEGFDSNVSKTLKTIAVEGTNYKQLVLDVGDYEHNGKVLKITQFGDSITEGIWRNGYVGTPNYRIPLMHRLETHGYKPMTTGFRGDTLKNGTAWGSSDSNGVRADPNYRLHNGVSAQRVYTGKASRAGFLEGIEAYLEASGDEQDVITLKIGTNDINGGETAANVYEGWVKLVNRLIKLRPQTRIVVTSILELANGNNTAGGTYSEMIKKAVEGDAETGAEPIFPANTVFYVDCRSASPQNATPENFLANYGSGSDYVHPNWTGYNKMADQWVEGVMKAAEASTGKTYHPNKTTGAAANVPAAYRKGFVKLATMDFSQIQKKGSDWGASPYTASNSAMADKKLTKVAYYVERSTDSSAHTQFVWADMDSWASSDATKNLNGMGVPTATQNNVIVENLHIYSNLDEIEKVEPTTLGVKGTLLFTNKGLGEATTDRTASGIPNSKYGFDWNDTLANNANWGAMVLSRVFTNEERSWNNTHRWAVGQTLFSYSAFNNANRTNVFGIGDFAVHCLQESGNSGLNDAGYNLTLNWVNTGPNFTYMTADKLDYGVIEIWGVPEGYVVPDSDEGVEVAAETADAAIAAAQIIPDTDADTAAGDAATRKSYLTITATPVTGEEGKFNVQAVVDNAKLPTKVEETAVSFAQTGLEAVAGATETTHVDVPAAKVVPGLYYSVSFGTTPDNHTQESERILATGSNVTIPVPVLGNEKVYYIKIKASATK